MDIQELAKKYLIPFTYQSEARVIIDKMIAELSKDILELVISTDSRYSFYYSKYILNTRFELGEASISTSPRYSVNYSVEVLKDKFPLGEPSIAKSDTMSLYYALSFNSRFELGEPTILLNILSACDYVSLILKHRWNELEIKYKGTEDILLYYSVLKGLLSESEFNTMLNELSS